MEELITILWKSALSIALFYTFYKVLLQKDTFFTSIRYFLVVGLLFSLVIPFVIIPIYVEANPTELSTYVLSTNSAIPNLNATVFDWEALIVPIYLAVTALLFLRFMVRIIAIFRIIKKGAVHTKNGINYVEIEDTITPFSFFNYVVYNPQQFSKTELHQIISHEKVHVSNYHSIDTILAHLLTTVQWFNPVAWLYKKEVCQNLEYLADKDAHKKAQKPRAYQHLLLKTTVPNYQLVLANNFYNSLLKKRIIMLHKQRSNSTSQWKMAFMLPLLLGFIFMFNTETIAQDKKVKIIKEKAEIFAMGIDKTTTKENLDKVSAKFKEKGLKVSFKNVKRTNGNIVSISIDAKASNGKASAAYASDNEEGIKPIQISYDAGNNNLSIGSQSKHGLHEYSFHNKDHKKMVVRTKKGKGSNVMVFKSDDDDENHWVTEEGTNIIVKVMADEDHEGDMEIEEEIIIEDENGKEVKKKIIKKKKSGKGNNFVFISDDEDGKSPMIIFDGKEISRKEMEAMDTDSIETVNVYKGDKAIEKYGKKAVNGVVVITSKKKK